MKKIGYYYFVLLFAVLLSILTGCSTDSPSDIDSKRDEKKEDIKPSDTALSAADISLQKMKDWQVEYVNQNNLMNNSMIAHYSEQEGRLEEYGYSHSETQEEAALLDRYHEVYGWWYLMRENMAVLDTQEYNDMQYSVVLTVGDEGCNGVHVVSYLTEDGQISIKESVSGEIPLSSGFYPNLKVMDDQDVFFGIIKKTRYDTVNDEQVPSGFAKIDMTFADGTGESHSLSDNEPAILLFYSETAKPVSCRLFGKQGEEIENYQLESEVR